MKLIVHMTDALTSEPTVIMNSDDCLNLGVGPTDRVRISNVGSTVTTVLIADSMVQKGTLLMPGYEMARCSLDDGDEAEVEYSPMPESIRSIRRKIDGLTLDEEELGSIVTDIFHGDLSQKEIIAFISAFNVNNSDMVEIAGLTRAMVSTGTTVDLGKGPLYDFHSLGGVPGNKITPIVVSIVASQGMRIPKLSSRAVSSACGTSDYVDTFCDIEMDAASLKASVEKTGGVFACGNEDYAPVGRSIIDAERPMGIDPRPMMMASIMSKKVAIGTTHLLIDIPMGPGTKVPDLDVAEEYGSAFMELGKTLGIKVECAVTYGGQPLGRSIGPILEARECIRILENGNGDADVVEKACGMAGMLLEMGGMDDGFERAREILRSGEAHRKFLEIVEVQHGDPALRSDCLVPGMFFKDIHAKRSGFVQYIDSASIVAIAKGAGAPADVGAGIEFMHKVGDEVSKGDVLFRVYAENEAKLERAISSARSRRPMRVDVRRPKGLPESVIVRKMM